MKACHSNLYLIWDINKIKWIHLGMRENKAIGVEIVSSIAVTLFFFSAIGLHYFLAPYF